MVQVDTSIVIARPPDQVFTYVADLRNDPSWHTDVLEAGSSTDAVGAGTVFDVKIKPSMGVSGGTMTVTRFEPGRLVELDGRLGKMSPRVTTTTEPDGGGTRLTRRVDLEPPGVMRLMSPMIKRKIAKDNEGFLANLKRVLEHGE